VEEVTDRGTVIFHNQRGKQARGRVVPALEPRDACLRAACIGAGALHCGEVAKLPTEERCKMNEQK